MHISLFLNNIKTILCTSSSFNILMVVWLTPTSSSALTIKSFLLPKKKCIQTLT